MYKEGKKKEEIKINMKKVENKTDRKPVNRQGKHGKKAEIKKKAGESLRLMEQGRGMRLVANCSCWRGLGSILKMKGTNRLSIEIYFTVHNHV